MNSRSNSYHNSVIIFVSLLILLSFEEVRLIADGFDDDVGKLGDLAWETSRSNNELFIELMFRRHAKRPSTGRLYRIEIAGSRLENRKRKRRRAFAEIPRNNRSTLEEFFSRSRCSAPFFDESMRNPFIFPAAKTFTLFSLSLSLSLSLPLGELLSLKAIA